MNVLSMAMETERGSEKDAVRAVEISFEIIIEFSRLFSSIKELSEKRESAVVTKKLRKRIPVVNKVICDFFTVSILAEEWEKNKQKREGCPRCTRCTEGCPRCTGCLI